MAYLGLARRWRSQVFADLVGQDHITRTLMKAIEIGRVSQGYLFTGTRGIGKTSAARIFAKALRCQTPPSPGVPCNNCTDCNEISEGRSIDVLEIDGASNNGVDAVREIRENAKYLPNSGKYKIYIIDEVHMLTTAAFNALLKTLEEPPAHVLFIFATTDPQKIPATVLSRVQRYDFKRVSLKDIHTRLKQICDAEKVTMTDDAIQILAREAEGSMRDAVSLLDQVLSLDDGKINAQVIANALGLVDKQVLLHTLTAVLDRQPLDAIKSSNQVYLHGFDLKQFGKELLRYLRQLMVVQLLSTSKNTGLDLRQHYDLSDVDFDDLKNLCDKRSITDLDMLFRLLNQGLEEVSRSTMPKVVMDVLLLKMASSEELVSLSDLSDDDFAAPSATAGASQLAARPAPGAQHAPSQAQHAQSSANAGGSTAAPTAPQQAAPASLSEQRPAIWKKAIDFIKSNKPLIASILENLSLEEISKDGGTILMRLGYTKDHSFYKEQLQSKAYNDLLVQLFKNHFGNPVRLEYREVVLGASPSEIAAEKQKTQMESRKKAVMESEAIQATQQLLGARLERLEVRST